VVVCGRVVVANGWGLDMNIGVNRCCVGLRVCVLGNGRGVDGVVVGRNDSVHGLLGPGELGKEKLESVDGVWCCWVRCVGF
jgi:hypothetical protein